MGNKLHKHWCFSLPGKGNKVADVSLPETGGTRINIELFPCFASQHQKGRSK
jgi:hypothetical protein